jgi:hypothetical protein
MHPLNEPVPLALPAQASTSPTTPPPKKSMFWIVIVVVVLLAVFGIILYFVYKKRKAVQQTKADHGSRTAQKSRPPPSRPSHTSAASDDVFEQIGQLDQTDHTRNKPRHEYGASIGAESRPPTPISTPTEPAKDQDILPI